MNMHEINDEIKRLEEQNATYETLTKLAVLYSIKDHNSENVSARSYASSEFMQVISGAPIDQALEILDEHMEAIRMLYPKEYQLILSRIRKIKID